jgi:hypothetical protein
MTHPRPPVQRNVIKPIDFIRREWDAERLAVLSQQAQKNDPEEQAA